MMGDKDVLSLVLFEVLLLVNSNIRFKGGRQTNKHGSKAHKKIERNICHFTLVKCKNFYTASLDYK